MKKLATLFAVALLASGCVVEFGNASGYDYIESFAVNFSRLLLYRVDCWSFMVCPL